MIEKIALEILSLYPDYLQQPASISGKYHIGETAEQHLKLVNVLLKHFCLEFNITGEEKDILLAAGWLHDIGMALIVKKGVVAGWTYYEATGYSKQDELMEQHGSLGAKELEKYILPKRQEIQRLVSCHMSHWYKDEPQPNCLNEYLLCLADYVASKGNGIWEERK